MQITQKYAQTAGVQVDISETKSSLFFFMLENMSEVTFYKMSLPISQHSVQPYETA